MFSFLRDRAITLNLKQSLLAVFFVLTFRVLQYFPGLSWTSEAGVVLVFISMVSVVFLKRWISNGFRYSPFEIYVFVILFMSVYAAFMARAEFGQPIIYGILTQRNLALAGSALLLLNWLRKGCISTDDIERCLVGLGWWTMIVYSAINLFIDPANYAQFQGFVGGSASTGYLFKFNNVFIVFAFLAYFIRGVARRNLQDYLKSTVFLTFLVFVVGGRSLLLSVLLAAAVVAYQKMPLRRILIWAPKMVVGCLLLFSFFFILKSDYLIDFGHRYSSAFTVILTGERTVDSSANARILETSLAWPYVKKNWLQGNGDLSNRWRGGYEEALGYFYPSDIGLLGAIYIYGLFGLTLFLGQLFFIRRWLRMIPADRRSLFIETVKAFLIYFFVRSLATGSLVHFAEMSLTFAAILCAVATDGLSAAGRQEEVQVGRVTV